MELIDKKNLREFLFYKGTVVANVKDVNLDENQLVVYSQRAYIVFPEDLEDIAFFDPKEGDTLFAVPKDEL